MPQISKLLSEAVVATAKKELEKLRPYSYISKKLQAVIAASEHGITDVARIYGVSRTTITEWIKHVKSLDLGKLQAPKERRKPHKLNEEQMAKVKLWVQNDPNITSKAVMIKIKEGFGIDLSIATAHRVIKRLNFSYITPRPMHYKQDKALTEEFKKKSKR